MDALQGHQLDQDTVSMIQVLVAVGAPLSPYVRGAILFTWLKPFQLRVSYKSITTLLFYP